jgi:hypothetical protein
MANFTNIKINENNYKSILIVALFIKINYLRKIRYPLQNLSIKSKKYGLSSSITCFRYIQIFILPCLDDICFNCLFEL